MDKTYGRKPWPARIVWALVVIVYALCAAQVFLPLDAFCQENVRWADAAALGLCLSNVLVIGLTVAANRRSLILLVPAILFVAMVFLAMTGHVTAYTVYFHDSHKQCVIF